MDTNTKCWTDTVSVREQVLLEITTTGMTASARFRQTENPVVQSDATAMAFVDYHLHVQSSKLVQTAATRRTKLLMCLCRCYSYEILLLLMCSTSVGWQYAIHSISWETDEANEKTCSANFSRPRTSLHSYYPTPPHHTQKVKQ